MCHEHMAGTAPLLAFLGSAPAVEAAAEGHQALALHPMPVSLLQSRSLQSPLLSSEGLTLPSPPLNLPLPLPVPKEC